LGASKFFGELSQFGRAFHLLTQCRGEIVYALWRTIREGLLAERLSQLFQLFSLGGRKVLQLFAQARVVLKGLLQLAPGEGIAGRFAPFLEPGQ
jgi:hypothetical protein